MIGIQMAPVDPASGRRTAAAQRSAVAIRRVMPGSPAANAKFKPGDVILAIEGQAVVESNNSSTRIASARIGESLSLAIWRITEENVAVIPTAWKDYAELASHLAGARRIASTGDTMACNWEPIIPQFGHHLKDVGPAHTSRPNWPSRYWYRRRWPRQFPERLERLDQQGMN